jgi:hypothetical protein
MNPAFLTKLITDDDAFPVTLVEPLIYQSAILNGVVRVPVGFVTDFASIPWIVQWRIPKLGPWNRAATIHDWMYSQGKFNGTPMSRKTADRVLLEALSITVPAAEVSLMIFEGVRLGGWWAWWRYRHTTFKPTDATPPQVAA